MATQPVETPVQHGAPLPERLYDYVLLGAIIAVAAGGAIVYFGYHGWVSQDIAKDWAYAGIGFPFLGLSVGLFIFSYGWQCGDVARAIRMTFWLCLGALALIVAALALLSVFKGRKSSGGDEAEGESGSDSGGSSLLGGFIGHAFNDDAYLGNGSYNNGGSLFGGGFGSSPPAEPQFRPNEQLAIHCLYCGERYVPSPPKAICPHCGHSAFAG
jgi:hypothetical protein